MGNYLIQLMRRAFPMLDFYLEYGAAIHALVKVLVLRPDVQAVLYEGQIRIGYENEHHEELVNRAGTRGVEPWADDFLRAARFAAEMPRKEKVSA